MMKFKIIFSCSCLLVIILVLLLIKVEVKKPIISSLIEGNYYLYLPNKNLIIYCYVDKNSFIISNLELVSDDIYLVKIKFLDTVSPYFYQVEKKVSLLSYFFTVIFKI